MAKTLGGMEFLQGQPLRLPPPPEQLPALPLHIELPERPEVMVGQTVRRGQVLLQPMHESRACFVSPITGTVREVTPRGGGRYQLTLQPPGQTVTTTLEAPAPRGRKLESWLMALRQVGPWADPDGGVGLISQLDAARNRPLDTLICVGVDPFPPYPDRSSLLLSFPDDAVLGTLVLADMLNIKNVVMQAGRVPALLGRLRSSCRRYRLRLDVTSDHYPAADPTLVAHHTAGRLLPHGHNPAEQGLLMITPWTAIRIGRWVTLRRFDVVRPLLIARCDRDERPTAHYALPGQPLAGLIPDLDAVLAAGGSVLAGNPMTGQPIAAPHAVPNDQTLLTVVGAAVASDSGGGGGCIQCGWCLDVCPTRLDPAGMYEATQRGHDDGWLSEQLPWCVECGLCSYVCPAALPLTQSFAQAQDSVAGQERPD